MLMCLNYEKSQLVLFHWGRDVFPHMHVCFNTSVQAGRDEVQISSSAAVAEGEGAGAGVAITEGKTLARLT